MSPAMPQTASAASPASANAVAMAGVNFGYAGGRAVLKGIDLTIPRGKVVAIMGGSGCGKTTLLRLIGGALRAQTGSVLVDGQEVASMDRDELFALRRKIGMLFQFGALFTDLSVFENVAFPIREHTDLPDALIHDLVLMKLHAVGLRRVVAVRHHAVAARRATGGQSQHDEEGRRAHPPSYRGPVSRREPRWRTASRRL